MLYSHFSRCSQLIFLSFYFRRLTCPAFSPPGSSLWESAERMWGEDCATLRKKSLKVHKTRLEFELIGESTVENNGLLISFGLSVVAERGTFTGRLWNPTAAVPVCSWSGGVYRQWRKQRRIIERYFTVLLPKAVQWMMTTHLQASVQRIYRVTPPDTDVKEGAPADVWSEAASVNVKPAS